jgi:RNA polymerase sigma factor (sigma-70 family)
MELALASPALPESLPANRELAHNHLIETAYAVHGPSLRRRLLSLTRDPAVAEDLTHEAFLRLSLEFRAGRAPDNIGAWLHRVGANLVASQGRHRSVVERRQAEMARPDVEPSPETASIAAEEASAVRTALSALGPIDRRALLMAAQGYRGPEIATSLGRTQGATRTLLCRARSKMRDQLLAAGVSR